jgi:cyclic beta-1,2-glucan synthetase
MYRSGIEGILGIRREGAFLTVDPSIPSSWPGFAAAVQIGSTRYEIHVDNSGTGAWRAVLDDVPVERCEGRVRVPGHLRNPRPGTGIRLDPWGFRGLGIVGHGPR